MILRFDGFQFQSVMPPATGCMKSYAAVGPNLLRHCKYGLFNSTLDEITPAGTVTTTRAVDGGDVFSIVGRSAQGVAALGFVGPTSFIGRLDLQGNFTPVVAAPSISLSELLEMGADENTVWPARRDMVFDLGAGTQTNVTVPTRSQFFSAGFGRVIAASPTSVSLAEGPLVRELLAPPSLSVQPSSRAAVWFFDGLSVISCPPALIVEPPTAFVPLSPIDLAEHPVTGERLAVTAQNVFRADGGVLPSLAGNQIPSRMIPFDRDQWLGIGETNGVSWTWSFDGVSWNQVALPNAPDAGRIVGLSASDAGVYAITSATLLSFDGTSWTSTTPPATGQLVGLCSLGPLLLIERRGAGTRSVQEYRPGVGFGSLRLVSTTHDLMCAGQRAFDVHRTNASVSEFMLDGGLEALQSPTRALGIVLDRQGREHLLGPSCSVLRRGP
ncbi:MAG: hypothetical protein Q8L14_12940 [Myxococcales bacterium]|nr:hypothetical protein [Myxococcales bacterium]